MKLRKWVKVVLAILITLLIVVGIINYINDFNEDYNRCMEYNNNNKNICDKLKN